MSAVTQFAEEYLLNSLWQAPLLCAAAWLLARMVRRLGPSAEHRVWVGALLAETVMPACATPGGATWLRHLFAAKQAAHGAVSITFGTAVAHPTDAAALLFRSALVLYAVVSASCALRLTWQCAQLIRLARQSRHVRLPAAEMAFLGDCCTQLRIVRLTLAAAPSVRTPLTFGILRPLLLLPVGFAEQASSQQLRAALTHELAHIARSDAAKHLLYRLLSLPVAYHPAAWLTLARIAETRERLCDQTAAAMSGGTPQYARALLDLASLLSARRPAYTHAIGLFDANQFERRVLMLNRHSAPITRPLRLALIAGSAIVATVTCASAVALHLNVAATSAVTANRQVKVASGVAAGMVVTKVPPKYPEDAKKAKIQGSVVLSAVIGKDGTVERLNVVSGPAELQAASLEAVRQWVYKPFLLNGAPTEFETTVTINYSLGEQAEPHAMLTAPADAPNWVAPHLLSHANAIYPPAARKAKIGGEVIVEMKVGADGHVSDVAALSGPEEFRAAATDAARQYLFAPATRNGQAVPVDLHVAIKFETF